MTQNSYIEELIQRRTPVGYQQAWPSHDVYPAIEIREVVPPSGRQYVDRVVWRYKSHPGEPEREWLDTPIGTFCGKLKVLEPAPPSKPRKALVTLPTGQTVYSVACPYCTRPTARHPEGQNHTFALDLDFDPDVEGLHCDFASMPFDVLIHADGTPEPIAQHDPRFVP